ncbi:hypothetical protein BV22DRAFT_1047613 [Leucogyrophana mollusca]|uniref:Uncharacterized protein n=1 Tax=Leucogyrophana mollusca TaxID=85980 RepID=A0ACB8BEN9_9AGAM|nr:hypothetical protein BV22DRAFT_1047613 [Leucogyrophana mollusca]
MLDLDEWDELLTNNFTDVPNHSVASSSIPQDEAQCPPTTHSGSHTHPLRRLSTSNTINHSSAGTTRPYLTRLISGLSETEDDTAHDPSSPEDEPTLLIHTVTPSDSFAGLALRYGVSIVALRRANHLWPTDPIHLRTQLVIPQEGVPLPKPKPSPRADPSPESTPRQPIAVPSTLFAARDAILAALPTRMSIDSLSSRTSLSEDLDQGHELDDFVSRRVGGVRPRLDRRAPPSDHHAHDLHSYLTSGSLYPLSYPDGPPKHYIGHASQYTDPEYPFFVGHPTDGTTDTRHQAPAPIRTSQLAPEPAMQLSPHHV